jgi:hypothetical protein
MSIFSFLGSIFKPATKLIDSIHTSDEEKLKLKNELTILQNQMSSKVLEYEKGLMEAQAKVIQAEAQGSSWLQRNWRPITMITFLILVVCDAFGLLTFRLAEQAWTLLQIGLGGYVIGRSVEKSAPAVIKALSKDK